MNLFDEYARIAFAPVVGHKNPEKPAKRLEALERAFDVGELVRQAVDEFCWQHINIERLHSLETTPERLPHENKRLLMPRFYETRIKFRGLFDVGVFSMAVTLTRGDLVIHMNVWNGERYVPASDMLGQVLPPEYTDPSEYDYDIQSGMSPGYDGH